MNSASPVAIVLGSTVPPATLIDSARAAEHGGFATIWTTEDYFMTGGVAAAAVALTATERIEVGVGLLSVYARHPALIAMEASMLAGAFPGRLQLGLGVGVKSWLDQMGIASPSPLATVREAVVGIRRLLAGESVDEEGRFSYRDVSLTYPTAVPPPLLVGAVGPKMLGLAGGVADGTILSALVGADYVRHARALITAGAQESGRGEAPHRITTFALFAMADDPAEARASLRPTVAYYLGTGGTNGITESAGISEPLAEMVRAGGVAEVERQMPDAWLDELCICGTPNDCIDSIARLLEAGSDSVALMPVQTTSLPSLIADVGARVLPHFRARDDNGGQHEQSHCAQDRSHAEVGHPRDPGPGPADSRCHPPRAGAARLRDPGPRHRCG